ncbi:MAG: hypothetical protein K940chlam5_00680 [Candidatus Anoxychlamydiales bacterium]|nr:hypothetical protein [Candidatus Anoxychlamydiales bacterium]
MLKYLVVLLYLFSGCKSQSIDSYKKEPKYVHLADEIIKVTSEELREKKNLILIGTGGSLMHEVKKISMSYLYPGSFNIAETRDLVIFASQLFLKNININEEIKPYLIHDPFQINDIKIFISTQNEKSPIRAVTLSSEKLIFYISDKEEVLKKIHEETYEEALKIVENEKSSKK